MAVEMDEIKMSQEIFSYLLENHELREENFPHLYKAYIESNNVQSLVKSQGEFSGCAVERYGDVIYLIPEPSNQFLGYSKADLKKELCKGNATDADYYLAQFAIIVLLLEFYDGQTSSSKVRGYIRAGELQNSISRYLKEGSERTSEEEQDEKGIAFSRMQQAYEALRSEEGSNKKTTKEGFLQHIINFLEQQGLIEYIEQDEMIRTTEKLDHFVDWNLLNNNNYDRVQSVLGE